MTCASFSLRPATAEDAPLIIEVHRAAVHGSAASFYRRDILEEWAPGEASPTRVDGLARSIMSAEELVVVADDSSRLMLGFGSIVPRDEELRAVYVRPDHGRKGIGGAILRRLEELAREAGLKELRMDASINAEAFYKACGFRSVGPGEHRLSSGARMACVQMRKSL